jgi:hypothetical protein
MHRVLLPWLPSKHSTFAKTKHDLAINTNRKSVCYSKHGRRRLHTQKVVLDPVLPAQTRLGCSSALVYLTSSCPRGYDSPVLVVS